MEVNGPTRNGGIGTGYGLLAELLVEAGHEVTILYLQGQTSEQRRIADWQREFAKRKIHLVPLPEAEIQLGGATALARSYGAYEWLREQTFDLVHFHEWLGVGYFSMLARRQGLAFEKTFFCVGAHSPTRWIREANQELLCELDDLEIEGMERRCAELADAVWCPSRYLADWLIAQGWDCEDKIFVQPYLAPEAKSVASSEPIRELVFFGRLEARKGLALFCDALDRLPSVPPVTFLGKPTLIQNQSSLAYLKQRAKRWSTPARFETTKSQPEALAYLRQPGRLAVMPSLTDNSPLAVTECLSMSIPFLASRVGGIPEVIHPEDQARCLFSPNADDLAEKLKQTLGAIHAPARYAVDSESNRNFWRDFHQSTVDNQQSTIQKLPSLSVCLVHHDRPGYLRQALTSLEQQTYQDFEVILVDDGSETSEAKELLDELATTFDERGWTLIRQENRYLGAARNAAARRAKGEYLLFMDDDNLAKPHEFVTLLRVASQTNADLVTCFMDMFTGESPAETPEVRWLFSGVDVTVGVARNCFGDANALVRRSCFESLGGFTEDYGVTHEDWEFFAKAILRGMRLEVVPEALFWYRLDPQSMIRTTSKGDNYARHLRAYLEDVPESMHDLFRLAQGQALRLEELRQELAEFRGASKSLRYRFVDALYHALRKVPGAKGMMRMIKSMFGRAR